ncbi:hypothetical protein HK100_011897 [Physocladia obscura]|uniref:Uncharacterized protein n=1 Tax=Physocladia obscura TaxID=109957 RepID=A0AAD5T1H4_9FUNG|nr:hypothetical protein HK100_011897 [Physocladia obscura]
MSCSTNGDKLPSQKAHDWRHTRIAAPHHTVAPFFADEFGRAVHVRGVNLCGQSKLPTRPVSVSTHLAPGPAAFFNHRDVSFVGRPFPLADATEHFARLRSWGLTFVRLLVTWEALEHDGPGIYDEEFIDYLVAILDVAERYGIKCFIDPHQDTWSRFSGGSGAPGWTFEVAGMDVTAFQSVGAAHVHNFNESVTNPHMFWPTNYAKLACATMFTLFFGGLIFAPSTKYKNTNIGTFLQDAYIACYTHLAMRLRHCRAVVGFEFMNEPHYGYIGLMNVERFDPMVFFHFGSFPSALQSFALGAGLAVDVDYYVKSWPVPTRRGGSRILNAEKRSAWLNYGDCIWKRHGVWEITETGTARILKPNYFTVHPDTQKPIDFYQDCYMPLVRRYKAAIQSVRSDFLVFVEPIPNEDPPVFSIIDREEQNYVYAPHWYDLKALMTKNFDERITFDVQALSKGTKNVLGSMYFGLSGAEKNYTGQIKNIVASGRNVVGDRPILMGECGIPMDINEKKAFETGDYRTHNKFLDTANMLNFTLWNYNPGNDNTHGDHWNGEDFSIFSPNPYVPAARNSVVSLRQSRAGTPSPTRTTKNLKPTLPLSKLSIDLNAASADNFDESSDRTNTNNGNLDDTKNKNNNDSNSGSRETERAVHYPDHVPSSPFEITSLSFSDKNHHHLSLSAVSPLEGDPAHRHHHDGGRALDAVVRPYAAKIAGVPVCSKFSLVNLVYTMEFTTVYDPDSPALVDLISTLGKYAWNDNVENDGNDHIGSLRLRYITEVFIPSFHYKFDYEEEEKVEEDGDDSNGSSNGSDLLQQRSPFEIKVEVSDGEWKYNQEQQTLVWHYDPRFRNDKNICRGGIVRHRLTISPPPLLGGKTAEENRGGIWGAVVGFFAEMYGL